MVLGRVCNIFSNYTLTDFMSTGKWLDRIGFTVKWFPWLIALLMFLWLILLCISIAWIFINPHHWCSDRWVDEAVSSVVNCRLIYSTDPCKYCPFFCVKISQLDYIFPHLEISLCFFIEEFLYQCYVYICYIYFLHNTLIQHVSWIA